MNTREPFSTNKGTASSETINDSKGEEDWLEFKQDSESTQIEKTDLIS